MEVWPTWHSDWAALWPTAASCQRWRPRRRGSWTMTDRRGGAGGEAAGRPLWSQCHPEACWRSARADSFLEEKNIYHFIVCFFLLCERLWTPLTQIDMVKRQLLGPEHNEDSKIVSAFEKYNQLQFSDNMDNHSCLYVKYRAGVWGD